VNDITVYSVVRESACSECGTDIPRRGLLRLENGEPLCMVCGDLDHLVVLPSGNAALTRRAGKVLDPEGRDRSFQQCTEALREAGNPGRRVRPATGRRGVSG